VFLSNLLFFCLFLSPQSRIAIMNGGPLVLFGRPINIVDRQVSRDFRKALAAQLLG
jgi:hypothetical protein